MHYLGSLHCVSKGVLKEKCIKGELYGLFWAFACWTFIFAYLWPVLQNALWVACNPLGCIQSLDMPTAPLV